MYICLKCTQFLKIDAGNSLSAGSWWVAVLLMLIQIKMKQMHVISWKLVGCCPIDVNSNKNEATAPH